MEWLYYTVVVYLILVNVVTFFLYGIDKRRAKRERERIPERTLLWSAALFGAAGALVGMRVFHHKTRKWKFRIAVPSLLVLQCAALVCGALWCAGVLR